MSSAEVLEYLKNAAPMSLITFILGFLTSRFTLTKKEAQDVKQKKYENTSNLMEKCNDRFQELAEAFQKYVNEEGEPQLDDFYAIATAGEKYFYQQKIVADAILSHNVDDKSRDNTFVPNIRETVDRTIPQFYDTLQRIARRKGFIYSGHPRRSNYESLYVVLEKYSRD